MDPYLLTVFPRRCSTSLNCPHLPTEAISSWLMQQALLITEIFHRNPQIKTLVEVGEERHRDQLSYPNFIRNLKLHRTQFENYWFNKKLRNYWNIIRKDSPVICSATYLVMTMEDSASETTLLLFSGVQNNIAIRHFCTSHSDSKCITHLTLYSYCNIIDYVPYAVPYIPVTLFLY